MICFSKPTHPCLRNVFRPTCNFGILRDNHSWKIIGAAPPHHPSLNLPEERLLKIENHLQKRVRELLALPRKWASLINALFVSALISFGNGFCWSAVRCRHPMNISGFIGIICTAKKACHENTIPGVSVGYIRLCLIRTECVTFCPAATSIPLV